MGQNPAGLPGNATLVALRDGEDAQGHSPDIFLDVLRNHDYSATEASDRSTHQTIASLTCARLGIALQDQGRFEGALKCFSKAIELDPESVTLRWHRAVLLKDQLSCPGQALPDLDVIVVKNPADYDAWATRGEARMMSGDLRGSLRDWARALWIDRSSKEARQEIRDLRQLIATGSADFRLVTPQS